MSTFDILSDLKVTKYKWLRVKFDYLIYSVCDLDQNPNFLQKIFRCLAKGERLNEFAIYIIYIYLFKQAGKAQSEYFQSDSFKKNKSRQNNPLRLKRLQLLHDQSFLEKHQKLGSFIFSKNQDNLDLIAMATTTTIATTTSQSKFNLFLKPYLISDILIF